MVMHHRLEPKKHRFNYKVFMFYIDLDEIELLKKKIFFFSHERFNFFSLKNNEHIQLPIQNPDRSKTIKEQVLIYLEQNNITPLPKKIFLLTNLNILGYNFNPVSFYFCFNADGSPLCSIAEVNNTFGEMKPYLLSNNTMHDNCFSLNTTKYFYVSPFFNHDANFDFQLEVPSDKLNIRIDTNDNEKRVFLSTLTGIKRSLNNSNVFWYSIRFPFLTLRIITLIHWNALILWLKKIPYRKKHENIELQKGVFKMNKNK